MLSTTKYASIPIKSWIKRYLVRLFKVYQFYWLRKSPDSTAPLFLIILES